MNTAGIKKYIFVLVFMSAAVFSFAQNIRVVGIIPMPDTGKSYQLQIGAFRLASNADEAAAVLTKNGFTPRQEQRRTLTRVFIVVPAAEVRSAIDRLGRAGFKEVVIREYASVQAPPPRPAAPVIPPKPVEPKVEPPAVVEPEPEPTPVEPVPEEPEVVEVVPAAEEVLEDPLVEEALEAEPAVEPVIEYEEFVFEAEEPEHDLMHLHGEVR